MYTRESFHFSHNLDKRRTLILPKCEQIRRIKRDHMDFGRGSQVRANVEDSVTLSKRSISSFRCKNQINVKGM